MLPLKSRLKQERRESQSRIEKSTRLSSTSYEAKARILQQFGDFGEHLFRNVVSNVVDLELRGRKQRIQNARELSSDACLVVFRQERSFIKFDRAALDCFLHMHNVARSQNVQGDHNQAQWLAL